MHIEKQYCQNACPTAGIMRVLFFNMPALCLKSEFLSYNVNMTRRSRAPGEYARVPLPAVSYCPMVAIWIRRKVARRMQWMALNDLIYLNFSVKLFTQ